MLSPVFGFTTDNKCDEECVPDEGGKRNTIFHLRSSSLQGTAFLVDASRKYVTDGRHLGEWGWFPVGNDDGKMTRDIV